MLVFMSLARISPPEINAESTPSGLTKSIVVIAAMSIIPKIRFIVGFYVREVGNYD